MKKNFILLPILGLITYVVLTAYSAGPGGTTPGYERTGASATSGCGTIAAGCHSTAASTITTKDTIELFSGSTPVTSYTGGASYTIKMIGTYLSGATSLPKFGFQLSARNLASTANAGTFTAITGTHLVVPGGTGVNDIEHFGSPMLVTTGGGAVGSTYEVDIPWTAPSSGFGTVKLFGVINMVNGDGVQNAQDLWNLATATINEGSVAVGTVGGMLSVCANSTTALTCTPAGGTWSSVTPAVGTIGSTTGIVTGLTAGTTTISYNAGSAGVATAIVTVLAAPGAVSGTATACIGATTTLSCFPSGGTWSSGTVAIGTVDPLSGAVTGVSSGTVNISYFNSLGCSSHLTVTINAVGAAPITGSAIVCVGTTLALTNLTPSGTWTSSTPAKATVNTATGIVTGVAVGTTTISYAATNSCGTSTKTHTVNVLAAGSPGCTTGVTPVAAATVSGLSIYPNPNNGSFTLLMQSDLNEEAHVVVCGISGEKVKEFTTTTNTTTDIRMPHVAGMYFISVTTSTGNFVSRLLIQ
jgi:hypothetical protein